MKYVLALCVAAFVNLTPAFAGTEARLLAFPAIHDDQIVFTYAGDLYTVGSTGGTARKLTNDEGFEMFARFSPDGKTIAFTGQYDGNTEVYVMPATGGVPQRLTYTATLGRDDVSDRMGPNNIVMTWTPDGQRIIFRSRMHSFNAFLGQLYSVSHVGRVARGAAPAAGGLLLLLSGRQEARLQPRLPRVPHLETLSRRHGRRYLDLRLRRQDDGEHHEQSRPGHHPDVERRQDLLPLGSRRQQADEPLRLRHEVERDPAS